MNIDLISYKDLVGAFAEQNQIEEIMAEKGIIGVSDIPEFEKRVDDYMQAARQFSKLEDKIKLKYAPNRDLGDTLGYELAAERFRNKQGSWQIDTKKASYYAVVPDHSANKWPSEMDLKNPYLQLAGLIFEVGKSLLKAIKLDESIGLKHEELAACGRMLHYHQENNAEELNSDWCGAHFDHGVFTGLVPAYYFQDERKVEEPEEAGLYIMPSKGKVYEKVYCPDQSILLFQVGEFAQLLSNDRIKATQHKVKKAKLNIERYSFALFYSAAENTIVQSTSVLSKDERYSNNQTKEGLNYQKWHLASLDRYRAV